MEKGLLYGISLTNSRSASKLDSYKCNVSMLGFGVVYMCLFKARGRESLPARTMQKKLDVDLAVKGLSSVTDRLR